MGGDPELKVVAKRINSYNISMFPSTLYPHQKNIIHISELNSLHLTWLVICHMDFHSPCADQFLLV